MNGVTHHSRHNNNNYIQSGAKKWTTTQSVNIMYLNCCSTMLSFLLDVDARYRIWRR